MLTQREMALLAIILDLLKGVRDRADQLSKFLHFEGDGESGVDMFLGINYEEAERTLYAALGVPFENPVCDEFVVYDYLQGHLSKDDLLTTLAALVTAANRKGAMNA